MSDSNVFFLNAHKALTRAGFDVDEIYRRLGINLQSYMRPGLRHPHQHHVSYWSAVEAVTGDREIGLHLCPYLAPFAGEVVVHLFVSSPTLGTGLQRALRYVRLLSDDLSLTLLNDISASNAVLMGSLGSSLTPRHSEITFFYGFLQAIRYGAGGFFKLQSIELRCPESDAPGEFEKIFGCPVTFGAPMTRYHFSRELLNLPLPHADPEMLMANEALAQRKIRKVIKYDRVQAVRNLIESRLEEGACSLDVVATELHQTPRSLRRELLDAGTNFNQLVTETRRSLAKRLLANSAESIEHIAHLVGFSERSAFFRAFKLWTGLTPAQYRKKMRLP